MAHRPDESDLLAWIEGEALDSDRSAALERAFRADPEIRAWAEAARLDRDRLRALAAYEAAGAPRGLTAAAMDLAEREALVSESFGFQPRARRIRVTPVRMVAAASVVIIAGAASLTGFLLGPSPTPHSPKQLAILGPREEPASAHLLAEAPIETQAESPQPVAVAAAPVVDAGTGAATTETFARTSTLADAAPARAELASVPASEPTKTSAPAPALTFRLIHPADHAPDHAIAPDRAAELVQDGRLLLLIRTSDPAAVEAALLSRASDASSINPRWRSILELDGGGGASAPSEAARVMLVDVLATPDAIEQLIADVTTTGLGTEGAWLQEMAESVKLKPRFEVSDLFWWNQPPSAWAPRATVPVLIERVATEPDAASPARDEGGLPPAAPSTKPF